MAKRKKRNRNKAQQIQKSLNTQSPEQLARQATQALSAERYKLALQYLKPIVKQAGNDPLSAEILALFQQAYTGRATELAGQRMVKEAIAIWEAAAPYGLDMADPRYVGWLMQTQQYKRLFTLYRKLPVAQQRDLHPHFAATLLSGETQLLKQLPDDDPVLTGYEAARQLLESWCAGTDASGLRELMKNISFRSPYRDLRQVIQAWLLLEASPDKAEAALQRLPVDSPFQAIATQVRLAILPATEAVTHLPQLSAAEKATMQEIKGWTKYSTALSKLEKLQQGCTEQQLFDTLQALYKDTGLKIKNTQDNSWLARGLKKTWVHMMVNSDLEFINHHRLAKILGGMSADEMAHVESLFVTADRSPPTQILSDWHTYRKTLQKQNNKIPESDQRMMSALILRYMADEWQKYQGSHTPRSIELLEESLQDDPTEPDVWAQVINYYLQKRKLKPARDTLKKALDEHGDHLNLLDLGIQVAIAGNAHKKAATYAKQILAVDPINTKVQQHLQNAHIAHARKVFRQGKLHLAPNELAEAQRWKGSALNQIILAVLQACLEKAENSQQSPDPLQSLAEHSTNPAQLDFVIRHEAHAIGEDSAKLLKSAGLADIWKQRFFKRPKKDSLLQLIETAQQFALVDSKSITLPLAELREPLAKAAKLKFTTEEGEILCEFWLQAEQNTLLMEYAKKLEKAWPDKPVFTYYRYATSDYDYRAILPLEKAWDKAREQGDNAVAARLSGLLQRLSNPFADRLHNDHFPEDDFFESLDDNNNPMDFDPFQSANGASPPEDDISALLADMAGTVRDMPLPMVKEIATNIMGKATVLEILKKFGEQGLRDLCVSALRNEDPDEAIAKLEKSSPQKPLPFGGLFG